jgi:cell division protein FtsW
MRLVAAPPRRVAIAFADSRQWIIHGWRLASATASHGMRWLLCLATLAVLARMGSVLLSAPDLERAREITVELPSGGSLELGREALAARDADLRHVVVRRDENGQWWLRNISATFRVDTQDATSGRWSLLNSTVLQTGQFIAVRQHRFEVLGIDGSLSLRDSGGRVWSYDGTSLRVADMAAPHCVEPSALRRAMAHWNDAVPALLGFARPLEVGGSAACGTRIALPDLIAGTARISREGGGYRLSAGAPAQAAVVCTDAGTGSCAPGATLAAREVSLSDVSGMVVGRTHFLPKIQGETLRLLPSRRVALWPVGGAPVPPPAVKWQVATLDPWQLPTVAWALALVGGICGLALAAHMARWWAHQRRREALPWWRMWGVVCCAVMAGLAVGSRLAGTELGAGWAAAQAGLVLLACAASHVSSGRPLPPVWLALLGGLGLLTQLELGLAAGHSRGLAPYQNMATTLSVGLALAGVMAGMWPLLVRRAWSLRRAEIALLGLAAAALLALAMQALFGNEGGVWGAQPVEMGKLALVATTAHALALRVDWADRVRSDSLVYGWVRVLAPCALLLAVVGVALIVVDDYSPFLLIAVWLYGTSVAYAVAAQRTGATWLLVLLAASAIVAIALNRDDIAHALAEAGVYPDRMGVWTEPHLHPHTGEQFLRARALAAQGGLWGTLEQPAAAFGPWSVPAVQDDFAPSFFLLRYGQAGGALLWALQVGTVCSLMLAGLHHLSRAPAGNHLGRWWCHWTHLSLWGGASFIAAHLLLSWGTNLGFTPVMGQPMTLLSAAGSHLLLLLLPVCVVAALPTRNVPLQWASPAAPK